MTIEIGLFVMASVIGAVAAVGFTIQNARLRRRNRSLVTDMVKLGDGLTDLHRRLMDHIRGNEQLQDERNSWREWGYEGAAEHSNAQAWLLRELQRHSQLSGHPIDPKLIEAVTGFRQTYATRRAQPGKSGATAVTDAPAEGKGPA